MTAIEWLINELDYETISKFDKQLQQAKEMEEEQMYSDMQEYAEFCIRCYEKKMPCIIVKDWFKQFKKK